MKKLPVVNGGELVVDDDIAEILDGVPIVFDGVLCKAALPDRLFDILRFYGLSSARAKFELLNGGYDLRREMVRGEPQRGYKRVGKGVYVTMFSDRGKDVTMRSHRSIDAAVACYETDVKEWFLKKKGQ